MSVIPNVSWGGIHKPTNIKLRNTCSLDTSLTILTALCITDGSVPNYIAKFAGQLNIKANNEPNKKIADEMSIKASKLRTMLDVVELVEAGDYSDAKSRWINEIQEVDVEKIGGDMVNSEAESAFNYIAELFPITVSLRCTDYDSDDGIKHRKQEYDGNISNIAKSSPHAFLSAINYGYFHDSYCSCEELLKTTYKLKFSQVPFIFYTLIHNKTQIYGEDMLPLNQQIRGNMHKVFAYTVTTGGYNKEKDMGMPHYIVKFPLEGKLIVYDGMCQPYIQRKYIKDHYVTSVWLKKVE